MEALWNQSSMMSPQSEYQWTPVTHQMAFPMMMGQPYLVNNKKLWSCGRYALELFYRRDENDLITL